MGPRSFLAKLCLPGVFFLLSLAGQAQFEVYQTVDDFRNGTPKTYPGFDYHSQKGPNRDSKIVLKNDATKEKIEVDCADIWGFTYKGGLYRIARAGKYYEGGKAPENMPIQLVMDNDGAFYWLNSPGMLDWRKRSTEPTGTFFFSMQTYQGFITSSLDGDMMLVLGGKFVGMPKWLDRAQVDFMRDNPQLKWLKDCVMGKRWKQWGEHYTHAMVKECLEEHVGPGE